MNRGQPFAFLVHTQYPFIKIKRPNGFLCPSIQTVHYIVDTKIQCDRYRLPIYLYDQFFYHIHKNIAFLEVETTKYFSRKKRENAR